MSLIKRNGSSFSGLVSDLLSTSMFLRPSIFDLSGGSLSSLSFNTPSVNIIEDERSFKFELAAPGLNKHDFKVETDNGRLTISCEKEYENREEKQNYFKREFAYDNFSRSFQLPENSMPEKIDAKYENGILKLVLPKKEPTFLKPKKEIKIS